MKALQALRGVSLIVAATTVAEIGDLTRFDSAKQIMAYLGLVPSEHSSGGTTKRGSITKTGNGHVRRVLVEAAHTYCHPARESRALLGKAASALRSFQKAYGQGQEQKYCYHGNCS